MRDLVLLDGFHAVKHGVRFGAVFERIVATEGSTWPKLAVDLAPDVAEALARQVTVVPAEEFARVSPGNHPTGIAGLAERPMATPLDGIRGPAPTILLEDPRRLGNLGAVIRVAAAAGAGAVFTSGTVDPWHPDALRGSAGLHFALPVGKIASFDDIRRPLIVMDASGQSITNFTLPPNAIIVFGTERHGVSEELKSRADAVVSLPMQPAVSSLNLATSVAATLYYWRLSGAY